MWASIIRVALLACLTHVTVGQNQTKSAYAPTHVLCPSNVTWLRPAIGISTEEGAWVSGRKAVVADALKLYLSNLNLKHFSADEYIRAIKKKDHAEVPILSLAISGGGDVSAFTGLGVMQAFDSRNKDSVTQRTGGILQSLTYLSGLSGGSWPVSSWSVSNAPTIPELIVQWQPQIDPYARGNNASAVTAYFTGIFQDIAAKAEAGFPISLADFLGRALSSELVPGPDFGANVTWSGVRHLSKFMNYTMPMPLLGSLIVSPSSPAFDGIHIPTANSTLTEMTPFEFGAWQGDRMGFTPTEYLGTVLVGGKPENASKCITGFDNTGFMLATASNAFNFWYLGDISNGTVGQFAKRGLDDASHEQKREIEHLQKRVGPEFPLATIEELVQEFNQTFNLSLLNILGAEYFNPWLGIDGDNTTLLQLVDGSESGQTIPLAGIMQPVRHPDFIIAYDASLDTDFGWQNGTNLIDTAKWAAVNSIPFPEVPTAVTILNRNYSIRPTFFGCNASMASGLGNGTAPIVLYISNAPYSSYTNFSYTQADIPPAQVNDIFQNSFDIVTQANGTLDSEWPECIGCAVIERSISRIGWHTTEQCKKCFAKYCWDGTNDAELNAGLNPFEPTMLLPPMQSFVEWNMTHPYNITPAV